MRQKSSSAGATVRAPRLVARLDMRARVTECPALLLASRQLAPTVSMVTSGMWLQLFSASPWSNPRARPPPPTLVTRQAGLSSSWLTNSPTRLACPAQVDGWLKG